MFMLFLYEFKGKLWILKLKKKCLFDFIQRQTVIFHILVKNQFLTIYGHLISNIIPKSNYLKQRRFSKKISIVGFILLAKKKKKKLEFLILSNKISNFRKEPLQIKNMEMSIMKLLKRTIMSRNTFFIPRNKIIIWPI